MSLPLREEEGSSAVKWTVTEMHPFLLCIAVIPVITCGHCSKLRDNLLNGSMKKTDVITKICNALNSESEAGFLENRKESCMMPCYYCLDFPSG